MGSLFAAIFCWGLPVDAALAFAGEQARAEVVDTRLNTKVSIDERHPTRVRFRYLVDDVYGQAVA